MSETSIIAKEYDGFHVVMYTPDLVWRENCYLLCFQDQECFIIDPGFACEDVCSYVESHGYLVKGILLTHAHHDHLASADYISGHFHVPCILHEADKRLLMHAPMYALRFAQETIKRPANIMWLTDAVGDNLAGQYGIHVIHTPGHTPGGVCYICGNVIFSGDTIVKGYVGRTDLPGSNREQLEASVEQLFASQEIPDGMDLYPGHGLAWTISEAREWWRNGMRREQKDFG